MTPLLLHSVRWSSAASTTPFNAVAVMVGRRPLEGFNLDGDGLNRDLTMGLDLR